MGVAKRDPCKSLRMSLGSLVKTRERNVEEVDEVGEMDNVL